MHKSACASLSLNDAISVSQKTDVAAQSWLRRYFLPRDSAPIKYYSPARSTVGPLFDGLSDDAALSVLNEINVSTGDEEKDKREQIRRDNNERFIRSVIRLRSENDVGLVQDSGKIFRNYFFNGGFAKVPIRPNCIIRFNGQLSFLFCYPRSGALVSPVEYAMIYQMTAQAFGKTSVEFQRIVLLNTRRYEIYSEALFDHATYNKAEYELGRLARNIAVARDIHGGFESVVEDEVYDSQMEFGF